MTATVYLTPARRAAGYRADEFTAEELFSMLPADGSPAPFYGSFGHLRTRAGEGFGRSLYRRGDNRVEIVSAHVEDRSGSLHVVVAYPLGAGRTVRLLTRS